MKTFQDKGLPSLEEQAAPPELQRDTEITEQDLAVRFDQLKKWYPQWFTYSDSIGERPIDGMMREIERRKMILKDSKEIYGYKAGRITSNVEQNWRVAPEYTEEQQMHVPPGMVQPMGRVM